MKRSVWSRLVALFVGLWFVAAAAGPELTHACPTHGSHAPAASVAGEHDGHGVANIAALASHHGSSDESGKSKQCSCLGQCGSTAPVAVVTAHVALIETTTVATHDAGLPDYAYVPVVAQHVLPLANAPPFSA